MYSFVTTSFVFIVFLVDAFCESPDECCWCELDFFFLRVQLALFRIIHEQLLTEVLKVQYVAFFLYKLTTAITVLCTPLVHFFVTYF